MKYRALAVAGMMLLLAVSLPGCLSFRQKPPGNAPYVDRTLEVTGYCKCRQCCGWHRNWYGRPVTAKGYPKQVGITASGKKAKPGTIAADTAVYPFGTLMYVPGYGYGRVEDRGGALKGQKLDLFFKTHHQALEWGRRKIVVRIWPRQG